MILILIIILSGCVTGITPSDLAGEYFNIGNAYFDLKKYDKAVFYYKEAYKLDNTLFKARFNIALSYIALNRNDTADKILAELLKKDSENVRILASLAYSYHMEGKDKEALSELNKILTISPENTDARNNMAIILWKQDRKAEAAEEFKKLLKYAPDDIGTEYNLGKILTEEGKFDEALKYLDNYIQAKPEDYNALNTAAEAYTGLENYSKALKAYSTSLSIDDKQAEIWFKRAYILLTKVEDPDKGLTYLRQSLELGYRNDKNFTELLNADDLLEKDKVKDLFKGLNIRVKGENDKTYGEPPTGRAEFGHIPNRAGTYPQ